MALVNPVVADCSGQPAQPNGFCVTRGTDSSGKVTTPLADPSKAYGLIGTTVSVILTIVIFAGAVTCIIYLIIGAIQWTTARGGPGAAQGRTTMTFAVLGLVLLALTYIFMLYFNDILPHG